MQEHKASKPNGAFSKVKQDFKICRKVEVKVCTQKVTLDKVQFIHPFLDLKTSREHSQLYKRLSRLNYKNMYEQKIRREKIICD